MAKKRGMASKRADERWYRGMDIPMSMIQRFARAVVERFGPDKIILFGSYAYGTPHPDSDVDILVVMPARNQLDQAFKIHWAIQPPFPLDLIVRTPKEMKWRLDEGESFLTEIVSKGKVLYEKDDSRVGAKGRGRLHRRNNPQSKCPPST
jgi:predicted nucleotidyltransferase